MTDMSVEENKIIDLRTSSVLIDYWDKVCYWGQQVSIRWYLNRVLMLFFRKTWDTCGTQPQLGGCKRRAGDSAHILLTRFSFQLCSSPLK